MDQPYGPAGLEIDAAYYNMLDIRSFMLMLKDPSYCYKFYWLEAIVNLISEDVVETTFNDIIDEMICNAWYSVREFHIHLSGLSGDGEVRDGLERAIRSLRRVWQGDGRGRDGPCCKTKKGRFQPFRGTI